MWVYEYTINAIFFFLIFYFVLFFFFALFLFYVVPFCLLAFRRRVSLTFDVFALHCRCCFGCGNTANACTQCVIHTHVQRKYCILYILFDIFSTSNSISRHKSKKLFSMLVRQMQLDICVVDIGEVDNIWTGILDYLGYVYTYSLLLLLLLLFILSKASKM